VSRLHLAGKLADVRVRQPEHRDHEVEATLREQLHRLCAGGDVGEARAVERFSSEYSVNTFSVSLPSSSSVKASYGEETSRISRTR